MTWMRIESKWDQVQCAAQKQWAKLTDEDLLAARGDQTIFTARLKDRYGLEEGDAQQQVLSFLRDYL